MAMILPPLGSILLNGTKPRKRDYSPACSKGSRCLRSELHLLQLGTRFPFVDLPPRMTGIRCSIVRSAGANFPPQWWQIPAARLRFHHWLARSSRAFCRSRRISSSEIVTKNRDASMETIFSLVPAFQILEVNTKAERDQKIQSAPRHRPKKTKKIVALPIKILCAVMSLIAVSVPVNHSLRARRKPLRKLGKDLSLRLS